MRCENYSGWDENTLDEINSRLDIVEEEITKIENIAIKTMKKYIEKIFKETLWTMNCETTLMATKFQIWFKKL